jgi:hypothetical protein
MSTDDTYLVAIRPLDFFRASEEVDRARVVALAESIRAAGCWSVPLPVERDTGLVMDGNHRLRVAHRLGLKRLPCVPLSYADPRVDVRGWRCGQPFDRGVLRHLARTGGLLPPKTTRHRFAPALPVTEIPLALLA